MSMWEGLPDLRKRNGRRNRPTPATNSPTAGPTPTTWSTLKLFDRTSFTIEKPLFDKTPNFRMVPWAPSRIFDNLPPLPRTVRPFDRPFTLKSFEEWKHFKLPDFKSELPAVTPSPSLEALHMTTKVICAISSLVGGCLVILIAYGILVNRKKRPRGWLDFNDRDNAMGLGVEDGTNAVDYVTTTYRDQEGVLVPAPPNAGTIEQGLVIDRTPSQPGEPGALNTDLPPPYYEFQPSTDKYIGEMPPPYSPEDVEQDHKQPIDHTNAIGFDAYIEHVDPEMRMVLVFDNGRIVERLSLDGNSYNNDTGVAANDNVC